MESALLALSIRAWAPVFAHMEGAVPPFVYNAFYPDGWCARQSADILTFLRCEGDNVWVAVESDLILGWVGVRLHPEDTMGEVYIIAVDPEQQRRGVATRLIDHALDVMQEAGLTIAMVETGGDPGHAPSRSTYERSGFQPWPVARYFRKI